MRRILSAGVFLVLAFSASAMAAVEINTASKLRLRSLKATGPNKADMIIEYRDNNGPFWSLKAIEAVKGIGPLWVDKNKKKIRITPRLRCWNCGRVFDVEEGQRKGECPLCKKKWPKRN